MNEPCEHIFPATGGGSILMSAYEGRCPWCELRAAHEEHFALSAEISAMASRAERAEIKLKSANDELDAAWEVLAKAQMPSTDYIANSIEHLVRQLDAESKEMDAAIDALRGLSNMYANTWDMVDGGLSMMDSGIPRFEAAHKKARKVLEMVAARTLATTK